MSFSSEGYSEANRWKWNETIGPLQDRPGRQGLCLFFFFRRLRPCIRGNNVLTHSQEPGVTRTQMHLVCTLLGM